ncbi:NADH dehydrogenase subunit J [Bacteroidales bacterium]|nr:NADH dehydrogenase subunit J [Bacteroidales bacterium]
MGATANLIVFYSLAAFILAMSVMAVTTKRILRAATYLLFVLIGTGGLYLMLNYHFLAAVQLSVYAGGILILFIFAIFLTSLKGDTIEKFGSRSTVFALLTSLAGVSITAFVLIGTKFDYSLNPTVAGEHEINMKDIGFALMGTDKYQYLLPFEILSILLLACIIGGILIARKR